MASERPSAAAGTGGAEALQDSLMRIADALERLSPSPLPKPDFEAHRVFVWQSDPEGLLAVREDAHLPLGLLVGVDAQRDRLLANLRQFASGYPANNALLWGARGMGKSALVKAVFHAVPDKTLTLIEIHRDDIARLHNLLARLRAHGTRRFLLFCDDLSFDRGEAHYKTLKAVLDGGVRGRPENVLLYATSNRRHLMPRDMIENERSSAISPSEAVEEKVSLSDRFGLWLGFHSCTQEDFLEMIRRYHDFYCPGVPLADLQDAALEWRQTRGAISGRVAWQFIQDRLGRWKIRHGGSGDARR